MHIARVCTLMCLGAYILCLRAMYGVARLLFYRSSMKQFKFINDIT